jgi:aspartate ammonia-lyase
MFARHCVEGMSADAARCARHVEAATATVTALVDRLGYSHAQRVAHTAQVQGKSIRQVVLEQQLLSGAEFAQAIAPDAVTQLGSRRDPHPDGDDS